MAYTENGGTGVRWGLSEHKPIDYASFMLRSLDHSMQSSKKSSGVSCSKDRDDFCQFTANRIEKIKKWLWIKLEQRFFWQSSVCLNMNWIDRSLQHLRSLIRNPFRKWLKCCGKQKVCMHTERVQAALSLTSVSAALATVAAATAASTANKHDSRTGTAIASAAALVAAHFADFAKCIGADQQSVLESVIAGRSVKHSTDVLELTTSAVASLQATREEPKGPKKTCIHASMGASDKQLCPFCESSLPSSGSEAECLFYREILARGAYFLVRVVAGKVHRRLVSICLDENNQVILKLTSRHLAGAVDKVEKRFVFQILEEVPSWTGRSLLYNGEDRVYFGLLTSEGKIEFECLSNYDHHIWTQGIFNLLGVSRSTTQRRQLHVIHGSDYGVHHLCEVQTDQY